MAVTLVAAPFRLHRFHRHFRRRRHRRCRYQLGRHHRVSYVYIIVPPGQSRQFPTTVVCDDPTIAFDNRRQPLLVHSRQWRELKNDHVKNW